ncbi:MAG: hypothetical protein IKS91_02965 [Spirochaetia bacterium]|nr:hypothetical protein [Spirochaetia bacterium]
MDNKNYFSKYPQFQNSIGGFDKKSFDIKQVKKEDIEEILDGRKEYRIEYDDFDRIKDNPNESIGVIMKLVIKYSRNADFLFAFITTKPGLDVPVLESIREEIKAEITDKDLARDTYKDFCWFLKNLKNAMIGYVQISISNSFHGAGKGSVQTVEQIDPTELKPSKYGGGIKDLPGCG